VVSEPDLFVVCKNCSSEVSPYVTECPYCGQRVRKRAPKIEKNGGGPGASQAAKPPSLPRLRRGEMPGISPDARPYATLAIIGLALVLTVALSSGAVTFLDVGLIGPPGEQWWRVLTTVFVHQSTGYAFITLVSVAIFGTHLERRFGPVTLILLFLVCGAGGAAVSALAGIYPAFGANGAALGLLCAWLVEDRRAFRRGEDRENDLLGVYVIAGVLALTFVADPFASAVAAAAGAVIGSLAGLLLSLRR
jgi:membrane associated rhomboid family serine protease